MVRIRPAALLQRSKSKPVSSLPFDVCTLVALGVGLVLIIFFGALYLRKGCEYGPFDLVVWGSERALGWLNDHF